jgi:sialic acid synthase
MPQIIIDGKVIDDDSYCYVIAEIGHNHQGDIDLAKKMFITAKESGADAVKLQKRDNRKLYTKAMYDKPYDHENSFGRTYGEHREFLEFGRDEYTALKEFAAEIGITLFATAFDLPSADFLGDMDLPAYKIASGDVTNIPLLTHVAEFQKPMIVSTGGATMEDVERMFEAVIPINDQLCILHCTAEYPALFQDLNLRAIQTLKEAFPRAVIGWSSHDNGIAMAIASYMLGARVIEKHFTLNHTFKGTDHAFSLEPTGFRKMVRDLRRLTDAMGDGVKRVYDLEKEPILKMGKKLVAARHIPRGDVVKAEDIAIKSPGDGLPPYEMENVIGRKVLQDMAADDDFSFEFLAE